MARSQIKPDDDGFLHYRYDKAFGPNDDAIDSRFLKVRPGSERHTMLEETKGWYQVDPKERFDADAAKKAHEEKLDARKREDELTNSRSRDTLLGRLDELERRLAEANAGSGDTEDGKRRPGRPSNAEKEAKARADAAEQAAAEKDAEIERLREQLAAATSES